MTYVEAKVQWLRQVEGRLAPQAGETAVYWPDADLTDILSSVSIPPEHYDELFAEYKTASGERWTPEVTEGQS